MTIHLKEQYFVAVMVVQSGVAIPDTNFNFFAEASTVNFLHLASTSQRDGVRPNYG